MIHLGTSDSSGFSSVTGGVSSASGCFSGGYGSSGGTSDLDSGSTCLLSSAGTCIVAAGVVVVVVLRSIRLGCSNGRLCGLCTERRQSVLFCYWR